MELNFLSPKGGYIFSLEERAMANIDVIVDKPWTNVTLTVKVSSYKKDYEKIYTLRKTITLSLDNFEFFFDDLKLGTYIVEATLEANGESITKSVPLAVVAFKSVNPANNYNWKLVLGDNENRTFANADYLDTATPGYKRSYDYFGKVDTDLELPTNKSGVDKTTAKFFYENDRYAYSITKDNKEIIAYKEDDGYIDVLAGGGLFYIYDKENNIGIEGTDILNFEKCDDGIEVCYASNGTAKGATLKTKYTFFDNCISVAASIKYSGDVTLVSGTYHSLLKREFLNESLDSYNAYNFDWRYPYDNDYPYRYTESWTIANTLDKNHRVYTFNRGDIPSRIWDYHVRYPKESLCTFFPEGNEVDYTLTYDLVLADRSKTDNVDYISMFEGKKSDFAAGIAPIIDNDDNTSIFVRDSLDLQLNVTNLVNSNTKVCIKYDVRDYYGSIVDAGEFNDEIIDAKKSINRIINIDTKKYGYGMFFVNLMVVSDKYTYREYYPLALLQNYEYKYNTTSPFGINQILGDRSVPFADSFSICNKVGVAVTRGGFIGNHEYCKKVRDKGIRIVAHGTKEKQIEEFGQYFDECMSGNEINLPSIFGIKTVEECFNEFWDNFYAPLSEACAKYGKTAVACGVSAGQTAWYDMLYEKGAWDKIPKISLHVYGIPYSPECPEMLNNIWSTEGGLIRTKNAIEKYGAKPFQVNEMGYHTARPKAHVCLRTQADYNIRSYILCIAYGAEHAAAYCFYDFSNVGYGTLMGDMEHHFGHFYMPDYFGRILPKPAGIAYANMTRVLESSEKITENERYSKNKVRAFTAATKEYGNVLVAWTNCSPLPNDTYECENSYDNPKERFPTMPWENQWKRGEWIFLKTEQEYIEVVDLMGHKKNYKATRGTARVELTGAPVFIIGAKLD